MWSNVEVCSQIGVGHTHLEEWGGKDDITCTVESWGRRARTQVNRRRHSSYTASYVLTCRLGLGCIGNTGCYTVQWGQLGLGRVGQLSSSCTDDRRHKHTSARSRRVSLRVL